jgi:hypothetical protein
MKLYSVAFFALFLCAACASNQQMSTDSSVTSVRTEEYLVRQPKFTHCELEAFISLNAARNAIVFGQTQESLLATKGNGAFQVAMVNELFRRMKVQGFRDYPRFAAEKFYQCVEREQLAVVKDLNSASICMARQDIPFYLYAKRADGRSQVEATDAVRKMYAESPKGIYPVALIDQTAPMVYRINGDDGFYELRRFSFETCLFPTDWKAWWDARGTYEH